MIINLQYDFAALLFAPQSFRDGVQAAANILDSIFVDPIAVNINVGYGDIHGSPLPSGFAAEGGPSQTNLLRLSYATLKADLAATATSADDFQAIAFLPAGSSLQGKTSFVLSSAQEKALGLLSSAASATDGFVGFTTSLGGSDLVAAALHEITHAMGRLEPNDSMLELFRYSSVGVHSFPTSVSFAPAAYFSLDGGHTNLGDFDTGSDVSDWANMPSDPFNLRLTSSTAPTVSPVDQILMDVLGFHRAPAPGRAPEVAFDPIYYLSTYQDVAAAHMDAQTHYDTFGWQEGWRNPDAFFSTSYYLAHNPDVARAGMDPLLHYELFGWKEGRDPGPNFSTSHYQAVNRDVQLAGMNPLDHYILYGQAQHRPL